MLVPYFGLWFMMDALLPEQLQYWLIYEAEKERSFRNILTFVSLPQFGFDARWLCRLVFSKKMGSLALFGMHRLHLLPDAILRPYCRARFGDYDLRYCIDHCRSDYRDDSFTNVVLERPLVD